MRFDSVFRKRTARKLLNFRHRECQCFCDDAPRVRQVCAQIATNSSMARFLAPLSPGILASYPPLQSCFAACRAPSGDENSCKGSFCMLWVCCIEFRRGCSTKHTPARKQVTSETGPDFPWEQASMAGKLVPSYLG